MPKSFQVLLFCALFLVLGGCAGQQRAAGKATPRLIDAASEPARGSDAAAAELSPEEAALLDDDWDDAYDDSHVVADPLEGFNRAMFEVNDKLYFWLLKPLTRGYRAVVPVDLRRAVANFFTNLGAPVRATNGLLQGKPKVAGAEVVKFLFNTTAGVLGFGDPATQFPALNPDPEDLGQTLGYYGISDGFYIVWPLLGPSTLRDTIGDVGDWFLNPITYVDPDELAIALSGYKKVNELSFRLGDYESLKKAALDPYQSLRHGYIQLRQAKIKK